MLDLQDLGLLYFADFFSHKYSVPLKVFYLMIRVYSLWGIPVMTPAPSPLSLSQPQAPLCSIRRNMVSESRNICKQNIIRTMCNSYSNDKAYTILKHKKTQQKVSVCPHWVTRMAGHTLKQSEATLCTILSFCVQTFLQQTFLLIHSLVFRGCRIVIIWYIIHCLKLLSNYLSVLFFPLLGSLLLKLSY